MMDHPPPRELHIPVSISAAYTPSVLQIYPTSSGDANGNGLSSTTNSNSNANSSEAEKIVRYRECQKNHAANMGSHAVDGCGEFMAHGEEGTPAALKCAACGCHRNFHRREVEGEGEGEGEGSYERKTHTTFSRASAPQMLMALSSAALGESDDQEGVGVGLMRRGSMMKKRFRTKFSQHQKERMYAFADQLGWRIQKHDEGAVQQFCNEVGVRRHVLKVWMHNNKHTLGKKA